MSARPPARVWVVDLDDPGAPTEATIREGLSESDWARAAAISTELGRRRWTRTRFAARALLGEALGRRAVDVALGRGPAGKPEVEGGAPHFSVSHSARLAVVGVSFDSPIGVDVERCRARRREGAILARVVGARAASRWSDSPEAERTGVFLDEWVRFEAAVKCRGVTLAGSFGDDVAAGLRIERVDVGPGYAGAAATSLDGPVETASFGWG